MSKKLKASHSWELAENEWYVEPAWVGRRLFEVERFEGEVCDPCCGLGNMLAGAEAAGLEVRGYDIVNRGYEQIWGTRDFLQSRQRFSNFVMNSPFVPVRAFAEHACRLAERKVAMVIPSKRIAAAGSWLRRLPLARIYHLTPRPSMPPGPIYLEYQAAGREASGDTKDYAVLLFIKNFEGEPVTRWLHRDGDQP